MSSPEKPEGTAGGETENLTEESNSGFNPKLYTFNFPKKVRPNLTYSVLAPSIWVLIDHLLAVVWHLYTGESSQKLGIVHLQWAVEFAKWIKDENGKSPTAIQSLILVIEDALMEKYANLSKIRPAKEQNESCASIKSADDPMNPSVTLNDILARSVNIPDTTPPNPCRRKMVLSKASGTPDGTNKSEPQDSNENDIVSFLNYLKKFQEEKVKRETKFLSELQNALTEGNLKNKEEINKLIQKMENLSKEC